MDGQRRSGHVHSVRAACTLAVLGHPADQCQPNRIAQGMQHRSQFQIRMVGLPH